MSDVTDQPAIPEEVHTRKPEFDCPVCMEFLVAPCSLTCGHTVCAQCLHILPKDKCPCCQTPIHKRSDVEPNLLLEAVLRTIKPDYDTLREIKMQSIKTRRFIRKYTKSKAYTKLSSSIEEALNEHEGYMKLSDLEALLLLKYPDLDHTLLCLTIDLQDAGEANGDYSAITIPDEPDQPEFTQYAGTYVFDNSTEDMKGFVAYLRPYLLVHPHVFIKLVASTRQTLIQLSAIAGFPIRSAPLCPLDDPKVVDMIAKLAAAPPTTPPTNETAPGSRRHSRLRSSTRTARPGGRTLTPDQAAAASFISMLIRMAGSDDSDESETESDFDF